MATPEEILRRSHVPNTRSVFFLGCFERRVTLFSQQVRALNLVASILGAGLVRPNGKVAIVGAGAAGVTAAVAFAKAAPGLQAIHLYEKRSELLELQQGSNRYLHPHNYDWPAPGADNPSAGLPFLNWRAEPARDVHRHLREEFRKAEVSSPIQFKPNTEVTRLQTLPIEGVRVVLPSGMQPMDIYDAVILSIGFGIERSIDGDTDAYWTVSPNESPVLAGGVKQFFISGNGDGGLVDFLGMAMSPMPHQALCEFLTGLNLGPARDVLQLIEEEAWAPGADVDLYEAYRSRVLTVLPQGVITEVGEKLRPNVRVRLHTNEPRLFRRDTAVLNRLGCALVLAADENRSAGGVGALTTTVGVEFDGPVPEDGYIRLVGEAPFKPYRRILRIGADSEANLAPFQDFVDRLPDAARRPPAGMRPSSPQLTPQAVAMFGEVPGPDSYVGTQAPVTAEGMNTANLRLGRTASGELVATGDVTASQLGEVWRDDKTVLVDCGWRPEQAPRLVSALARLCGHAPSAVVFSDGRRAWDEALRHALHPRALPGNMQLRVYAEPARSPPPTEGVAPSSPDTFVEAAHRSLDAHCLHLLNDEIAGAIGRPDRADCGWVIEAGLCGEMWALWQAWRALLEEDPQALRRFLVLLADETDFTGDADTALVRVGPKTIRAYLLKPTLLALAFVVGSEEALSPARSHPGNLEGEGGAAHACGVAWIDGRTVSSKVAERRWSTPLVLLAELETALEFIRAAPRMDEDPGHRPRIGESAANEAPLILGADERFQEALEQGREALALHLSAILERRAAAAAALIEGHSP